MCDELFACALVEALRPGNTLPQVGEVPVIPSLVDQRELRQGGCVEGNDIRVKAVEKIPEGSMLLCALTPRQYEAPLTTPHATQACEGALESCPPVGALQRRDEQRYARRPDREGSADRQPSAQLQTLKLCETHQRL